MTQNDWQDLQRTIAHMTRPEKIELINRIEHSFRAEQSVPADQRRAMVRLRQELASLPVCNPADGWSNRQHDDVLYDGIGR